jgi:hypothetical protein
MFNTEGLIDKVYLYQGDNYICQANKIEAYQEAKAERTERDEQIRREQSKRQKHFHKLTNDEKSNIFKVGFIENDQRYNEIEADIVPDVPEEVPEECWEDTSCTDYVAKALDY